MRPVEKISGALENCSFILATTPTTGKPKENKCCKALTMDYYGILFSFFSRLRLDPLGTCNVSAAGILFCK